MELIPLMLRRPRGLLVLAGTLLSLTTSLAPRSAQAFTPPRDEMRAAYDKALEDANNLEYDAALKAINDSIVKANDEGNGEDPVLASLYLLRAALTYSAEGEGARDRILADLKGAVILNYYVVVPIEMRSEELTGFLQEARQSAGLQAPQPITLVQPTQACGTPLLFEVLLAVPDGGSAALYWRKQGSEAEFVGADMPAFSNVAEVELSLEEHGETSIEYFIYGFDASSNPVANLGLQDAPLTLEQSCVEDEPEPVPVEAPPTKPKKTSALPRGWFNLGIGTGIGIARGTAANTYQQFFPKTQGYGAAEAGCAIARWVAGPKNVRLVSSTDLQAAFEEYGAPGQAQAMVNAFDINSCAERHPVSTGLALAPLHIAPELNIRVGKRLSLGLFSRLQVVSGSKAFRDDPSKQLAASFIQDVRAPNPQGIRQTVAFAWSLGMKLKYFMGRDEWKVRPYVGAMAGYGNASLRVNMGFTNDRNGNSIPDDAEIGKVDQGNNCFPVWPYNSSCADPEAGGDNLLALGVASSADGASRLDEVRIGPVFIGGLVGFNYQLHKHFALFGELSIAGYFPTQGSMLIDFTLGPAITF